MQRLSVAWRSRERVAAFVDSFTGPAGVEIAAVDLYGEALAAACREADLIVNSTSVGMRHTDTEAESPLAPALIEPGVWAFDLVYNPLETPFLAAALAAGARPIGGLEMLLYQAEEAVRLWTGREPSVDIMRRAAQTALEQLE